MGLFLSFLEIFYNRNRQVIEIVVKVDFLHGTVGVLNLNNRAKYVYGIALYNCLSAVAEHYRYADRIWRKCREEGKKR